LLVEVQALVDNTQAGQPRRVTVGFEQNRLAMLLAVMHRHAGVSTFGKDIFINIVGGIHIGETGVDLPVILAIISSLRDQPLPADMVVFGEAGLAGEIRPVQGGVERLAEAAKHGFKRALIPQANRPRQAIAGLEPFTVARLAEALRFLKPASG